MNPDEVGDMIQRYGRPITLRRLAPNGIRFDVTVTAIVRNYAPTELVGGIAQGDRKVIISNREIERRQWPGPPRDGDQCIIDGKTTTLKAAPATVKIGDDIIKHTLQVRGA